MQTQITASPEFKRTVTYAILSIVFFIVMYLTLIAGAFLLVGLCCYVALHLLMLHAGFITLMVGIGLVGMSILILIFLFKFTFAKHTTDRTHLIEITEEQEPVLFAMIREIVEDVKTDFPKRVYLSADVNAAVFYDSSFWSMFFPIKKNLQIGIGLVNSVSVVEFKAILAHEFGHFSQRSMKVGTYVSNVNQIIFNLLNDNESYNTFVTYWANLSAYFSFFVMIAVKIIGQIQWVLKQLYEVVNLNYLKLSREMEFDADEVAAQVAGSKALETSLMRINLADFSYNAVMNHYYLKLDQNMKTENIYPQQKYVMNIVGKENNLIFEHDLPQITIDYMNRHSKSKLDISAQWNSHPSTEDRVARLEQLNIPVKKDDTAAASVLFHNITETEQQLTKKLFALLPYTTEPESISFEKFTTDYTKEFQENSFGKIFNTYYDYINPHIVNIDVLSSVADLSADKLHQLYSNHAVELAYRKALLENDIAVLKQVANRELKIKWFQYDGIKYFYRKAEIFVVQLEVEVETIKKEIEKNDAEIYSYFYSFAIKQGAEDKYKALYKTFFETAAAFDKKAPAYTDLIKETGFIYEQLPFKEIEVNLLTVYRLEKVFKKEVEDILSNPLFAKELTDEMKETFTKYLSEDREYFRTIEYDQAALEIFFTSLNHYQQLLSKTIFGRKKDLLDYKKALIENEI